LGITFARFPDPWLRDRGFTPYFIRKVSWVTGKSFPKRFYDGLKDTCITFSLLSAAYRSVWSSFYNVFFYKRQRSFINNALAP